MTSRNHLRDNAVGFEKLAKSVRLARVWDDFFSEEPICYQKGAANGLTAPAGTDATVQGIFSGKHIYEYVYIGTQTILRPVLATDGGWDIALDQTAGEGIEINFGSLLNQHPRVFRAGTDEWFARVLLAIEDVSGADIFFGGRKLEAYQAALATYTDLFGLRILGDSSSAAGAITAVTNLNDASDLTETTLTSTAADGTSIEFEVQMRGRSARFFINGAEVNPTPSFTVDSGDYFTHVLRLLHTTDVAGIVKLLRAQGGLLADRPDETLVSAFV